MDRVGDAVGAVAGYEKAVARVGLRGGPKGAGHAAERVSYVIDLPFVSAKEKDLVFDDRAADAAAVLFQRSRELGVGNGVEKVAGVRHTVAPKREPGAVNLVGAGLETHVNHRSRLPPEFGRCKFFHVKLLNRVDGQNGRRIPSDTGAVDDGLAGVGLAVEQALNKVGVVFRAQSVRARRRESSAWISRPAGTQLEQVLVVPAIQRQIVDLRVAQRAAQSGGGSVDQRNLLGYDHRLGNLPGREGDVDAHVLRDFHDDVYALHGFETLRFCANLVNSGL